MLTTHSPNPPRSRLGIRAALVVALSLCLVGMTACGVILYPQRKGQTAGRIDPTVAILDGIGLLFFLVPGVIAYAVDFATGTIYLPGTSASANFDLDDAIAIHTGDRHLDAATIRHVIKKHTGKSVFMTNPRLRVRKPSSDHWQRLSKVNFIETTPTRTPARS